MAALGSAPVKGSRWQWLDRAVFDHGGIVGDRAWALVDDGLRCLRSVAHPELARWVGPEVDELAQWAATDLGAVVTVTYWGRPVDATLHDGGYCSALTRELSGLTGVRVRLAHTRRRPGFVWDRPVSLVLASELVGLPGGPDTRGPDARTSPSNAAGGTVGPAGGRHTTWRPGTQTARYRPNVLVDDLEQPLGLVPGQVVRLGDVQLVCHRRLERCTVIDHDPVIGTATSRTFRSLPDRTLGWGCDVVSGGDVSRGTLVDVG